MGCHIEPCAVIGYKQELIATATTKTLYYFIDMCKIKRLASFSIIIKNVHMKGFMQ